MKKTDSGLEYRDIKVGDGPSPKHGQTCVMHYTGWLWQGGAKGKKFDSSVDRGKPFPFPLGARRVIAGWDEGVATMKVGGKRELLDPARFGLRRAGCRRRLIPPNATLLFEVELLERSKPAAGPAATNIPNLGRRHRPDRKLSLNQLARCVISGLCLFERQFLIVAMGCQPHYSG